MDTFHPIHSRYNSRYICIQCIPFSKRICIQEDEDEEEEEEQSAAADVKPAASRKRAAPQPEAKRPKAKAKEVVEEPPAAVGKRQRKPVVR